MIGIVLDCGFVILKKTNCEYSNEVNLFLTKRFCFCYAIQSYYFISATLKGTILFYVFESFEKKRDVIENRPALPRCMCIMYNLDVFCFFGSMIRKKRNVKKNRFVLLQ